MFLAVIAHRLKETQRVGRLIRAVLYQADTKRTSAEEIIRILVRRDLLSYLELWGEGVLIEKVQRTEEYREFRARY
eukprot:2372667-Rhodomonas_salina.2